MLEIVIPAATDIWDSEKEEFVTIKETKLRLEHSLVSLSKWESIWKKPYLTNRGFTYEESISYVKCMTLTQNVDPNVYRFIDKNLLSKITSYINDPMTATTINRYGGGNGKGNTEVMTAEVIYYYMFSLHIPKNCEKWHLNKLLMLLEVFSIKNAPEKQMSETDIIKDYDAINKARREKLKTKG